MLLNELVDQLTDDMIVNVIGSNFSGKTTLIQNAIATFDFLFLDIRRYREIIDSDYYQMHRRVNLWGLFSMQWRILKSHAVRQTMRLVANKGSLSLALRYWRYLAIHIGLAKRVSAGRCAILDEGLIKKFFEAVPFVNDEGFIKENERWNRLAIEFTVPLLESIRPWTDILVYVFCEPIEIARRARQRDKKFFHRAGGEKAILNRFAIQSKIFAHVMHTAASIGFKTYCIDTTDEINAKTQFNNILVSYCRDCSQIVPMSKNQGLE